MCSPTSVNPWASGLYVVPLRNCPPCPTHIKVATRPFKTLGVPDPFPSHSLLRKETRCQGEPCWFSAQATDPSEEEGRLRLGDPCQVPCNTSSGPSSSQPLPPSHRGLGCTSQSRTDRELGEMEAFPGQFDVTSLEGGACHPIEEGADGSITSPCGACHRPAASRPPPPSCPPIAQPSTEAEGCGPDAIAVSITNCCSHSCCQERNGGCICVHRVPCMGPETTVLGYGKQQGSPHSALLG